MPKKTIKKTTKKKETDKKKKPIWTLKDGNVQLSLFKNKNKKGEKYPIFAVSIFKFPFQYNQKMCFTEQEMEKFERLIKQRPEIKRK